MLYISMQCYKENAPQKTPALRWCRSVSYFLYSTPQKNLPIALIFSLEGKQFFRVKLISLDKGFDVSFLYPANLSIFSVPESVKLHIRNG